jgi:hypothetical protein
MTPTIILSIALGLIAYWLIKISGEIKSPTGARNCKEFFTSNWVNLCLSLIGAVILVLNGTTLPLDMGEIKGIIPAFVAGGSIPSMVNNVSALFKKA